MKGKVIRGSGFRGVLNYVLDRNKQAYIVGGNLVGRDARTLAKEFAHVRRLRPGCKKPVLHIPLRLPEGEDVSDARWLEIALFFMKLMQLSPNRPWVIVKHVKNHIHLVTSRVDDGGRIWTGKWEGLRCIEATQQIERHFGLTLTPGLRGRDKKQVRLTSGQLRKMQREVDRGRAPEVPAKIHIAERIEKALGESNGTFEDFKARLEKLGVSAALNTAKTTSHVSGISFAFEGVSMKGSKVARAYSWQGLNQLLAARRDAYENEGVAQPNLEPGPQPDNRRATPPGAGRTGPGPRPAGNHLAGGSGPIAPATPLAVRGDGHGNAGAIPDLLLSLVAGSPVTAGVGAGPGSGCPEPGAVIGAGAKAGPLRGRAFESGEEDDGPEPEPSGPEMSF
jgi:hypothetical protein